MTARKTTAVRVSRWKAVRVTRNIPSIVWLLRQHSVGGWRRSLPVGIDRLWSLRPAVDQLSVDAGGDQEQGQRKQHGPVADVEREEQQPPRGHRREDRHPTELALVVGEAGPEVQQERDEQRDAHDTEVDVGGPPPVVPREVDGGASSGAGPRPIPDGALADGGPSLCEPCAHPGDRDAGQSPT